MENTVGLTTVINGFKGVKVRRIAELLFTKEKEVQEYLINFSGKGFNATDDLFTYRSHRIVMEDISLMEFEASFLGFGICSAVSKCFYQYFEEEEEILVNSLFIDSDSTCEIIFEGIKNNNDLSLYKFIL